MRVIFKDDGYEIPRSEFRKDKQGIYALGSSGCTIRLYFNLPKDNALDLKKCLHDALLANMVLTKVLLLTSKTNEAEIRIPLRGQSEPKANLDICFTIFDTLLNKEYISLQDVSVINHDIGSRRASNCGLTYSVFIGMLPQSDIPKTLTLYRDSQFIIRSLAPNSEQAQPNTARPCP